MKKLIITVAIILITITSAYAQSLKSISSCNSIQRTSSNETYSLNLRLNYYLSFVNHPKTESGFGFLGEFQLLTTNYFGWIFNFNVLSLSRDNTTKFGGLVLTVGPKHYFNKSDLQGYASFGAGVGGGGGSGGIVFTPALGLDYKINNGLKLNLETKSNIYMSFVGPVYALFFNAGIGIIL